MAGDNPSGTDPTSRAEQQSTPQDQERMRQAGQAETGRGPHGGEYEPRDSRNITGVGGPGTGQPGGADQQDGGERWSGDAEQNLAAEIDAPTGESPEAQHMASANVPGFGGGTHADQAATQDVADGSAPAAQTAPAELSQQRQGHGTGQQSQSMGTMSQGAGGQSLGGQSQGGQPDPNRQGFVDQQAASHGGLTQQQQEQQQQARLDDMSGGEQVGDDGQLAATHGIDVADQQPGTSATGAYDQQAQFDSSGASQTGAASGNTAAEIREHMEVVGADDVHLGTVDAVEGDRIKLTKRDSDAGYEGGQHHGHHHYISRGLVAAVEGDRVRLSATAANAYMMEEEQ